jgi:chromosome transmission fidelity protein 1
VTIKEKSLKEDLIGVKMVKHKKLSKSLSNSAPASDEPEWIIEQVKARKRREMLRGREEMETRLAKIRAKEKVQKLRYLKGDQDFKRRKTDKTEDQDDEEQYVLDDYESEDENGKDRGGFYSAATLELMEKMGMGPSALRPAEDEVDDETKVCHRNLSNEHILTISDILLLTNPFSTYTVHQRASPY